MFKESASLYSSVNFAHSEDFLNFIAVPQGGFIAPHAWEIVCRKNLAIFKVCHYSRFYIMISLSFRKIEAKNLNSYPCILLFRVLGTTSAVN